jgi:hypothetical protein
MKNRKAMAVISAVFLISLFLILTRSAAMVFVAVQNVKITGVGKSGGTSLKNLSSAETAVGDKPGV